MLPVGLVDCKRFPAFFQFFLKSVFPGKPCRQREEKKDRHLMVAIRSNRVSFLGSFKPTWGVAQGYGENGLWPTEMLLHSKQQDLSCYLPVLLQIGNAPQPYVSPGQRPGISNERRAKAPNGATLLARLR